MSQSEATKRPAPNHIAIIMDGNGRWAQSRGLPRSAGHKAGVEAVRRAVKAAEKLDLKYLTLFGFSTENWNRPRAEIDALFDLLRRFVNSDLESLKARNVRIRILGARENLSADLKEIVERAENETRDNTGPVLSIAFNYGGRDEIVRAARRMADAAARGELNVETMDESGFARFLDSADLPDPDLVIRTSGEQRLSNFLVWQAAYAEFCFADVLWPDFAEEHLRAAMEDYCNRERRFGGLSHAAA